VITDAISDENVLKFSVEYVGRYKHKDSVNEQDIEVEAIDTKELMESPQRLEKIVDYILANHDRKTHARDFNAIFAVSSVDVLCKYYELFQQQQKNNERKLKVATIFSYTANEDDNEANSLLDNDINLQLSLGSLNKHSRDRLESYIGDYNQMFGSNYTTKDNGSFYNYYRDIADKVKKREIDILLVVNMFLTGFDSPSLNTLYVDKNLRYHGLLQAYSRTNRILNETKSQGNIVAFRNLKKYTDDAVALFSTKDAEEEIFMAPYEEYVQRFNEAVSMMQQLTPTPPDVDILHGEEQELEFVKNFREVIRLRNILGSFADFDFSDTGLNEQEFEDFKSKYLDIYRKVQSDHNKEKVSILEDVDFELELIRRDEINVDYIVKLLAKLVNASEAQAETIKKNIFGIINSEITLVSKRELIEKFINSHVPEITDSDEVERKFEEFWSDEKAAAIEQMCQEEGIETEKIQSLIDDYLYSGRKPRGDDIVNTLSEQPSVLKRKSIIERVGKKLNGFSETFINGV
jgi:type I restriction enzyme R subunit